MKIILMSFVFFLLPAIGLAAALTDAQIREQMILESISQYPGRCPCPYNLTSNGRKCGKRSAWSKAGGYAPICYPNEITDDQVAQYRRAHGL